jgi:hypothetical protein
MDSNEIKSSPNEQPAASPADETRDKILAASIPFEMRLDKLQHQIDEIKAHLKNNQQ